MSEPGQQLADIPFVALMEPEVRGIVMASFVPTEVAFGTVLLREGEVPEALYVVLDGTVRVVTQGADGSEVTLARLGPGDTFGEIGLLTGVPSTATVRASGHVRVAQLHQTVFRALVDQDERVRAHVELRVRQMLLHNLLQLKTRFGELPPETLRELLEAFQPMEAEAGATIVQQGDPPGPLFVVEQGRLRVRREDGGGPRDVAFLRRGDVFGERSLLAFEPRSAAVQAVTDVRLLQLPVASFQQLLDAHRPFRASVEELVATYRHRAAARVPLDFADDVPLDEGQLPPTVPAASVAAEAEPQPPAWEELPAEEGADAGQLRVRRLPLVLQVDEADCGAACVAMVVRHFGRRVSLAQVRDATDTTIEGTSMRGIARGAEALGLAARSVKASKRRLGELPLPAICHDDGDHWVVLTDVRRTQVRFNDPALGRRRLPRAEFEQRWTGFAVLLSPTQRLELTPETTHPTRWLVPFIRRHRRTFVVASLLSLAVAALELLVPVVTQVVVDRVLPEADVGLLRLLVLGLAGVLLATAVGSYANRWLLSRAAVQIDGDTLDHVAARMFALPMRYFQTRRTGDIQRRLVGLRQVRAFAVAHGVVALTAVAQLVASVVLMLTYSRLLTVVFLAAVPVYAALIAFALARIRPLTANLEESFGDYHSRQIDSLRGIETVKAMGAEDRLRRSLTDSFRDLAERQRRHDLASMSYETGVHVISLLSLGFFLYVGTLEVLAGRLSIGQFVAFNSLVALAINPIRILLLLWDDAQQASVLLSRLDDIFLQEPEQGARHSRPVPTLAGDLRLDGVSFRYGGPDATPILDDVTLDVPAGMTVAIIGRSGSGKTTLVRCMAGLLAPTSGTVCVDGIDVSTLDLRQLRRHIAFLPQDIFVFADTISNNIAFGDDDPDPQRVRWAAEVADAHRFITELPLGYATKVGETGLLLSGGQRQRIAIARAAYRRPAIVILDEATSNLDAESERAVQDNLDRLLEGPTSIVVAHRLSTIRHADVIVVLERGRVVEQGTHDELMGAGGLYAHLTSQQLDL